MTKGCTTTRLASANDATWGHNPEDQDRHFHRSKSLIYHTVHATIQPVQLFNQPSAIAQCGELVAPWLEDQR
jgi:hypothetical protein